MTSEEAINVLLENVPKCCKMVDGRYQGGFDDWDCDMGQAIRVAVLALQDVRNYQKIGTVEEVMQNDRDLKRQTEHSEHLAEVLKATQNLLEKRERLLKEYCKIGTVEECQEAREKQKPKKPVCKPKPYNESVGFNEEWFCPSCGAYIGYFYEGMDEPEQMEYCNECGQHIARDWSDENEDE